MRLRQVALVARELERAVDDLRGVLGLAVAFRDPGVAVFGLANAVLPVGDQFLEIVSPVRDDAPAARLLARRGVEGSGYMLIVQTRDLDAARARVAREGVRIVFEHAHADGHTATIHLHPRDVGGAILSFDVSNPPESWDWAGRDWQRRVRTDVVTGLAGATLASAAPAGLSAHWGVLLDHPAAALGGGVFAIALDDGGRLRFVPTRGHAAAGGGDRSRGGSDECLVGIDLVEAGRSARIGALARARARGLRVEGDAFWCAGTAIRLVEAEAPR
jgi:catechol 2,3-dioxygenase-like lactoylglutathione lyase family enzyme